MHSYDRHARKRNQTVNWGRKEGKDKRAGQMVWIRAMVLKLSSWNPDPGTGPQVLTQRVEEVTQLRVQSLLPLLQ